LALVFSGALGMAMLTSACVTEPPDVECLSDTRYFQERVWNAYMSTDCFACHNAQGVANTTDFVLKSQNEPGFLQKNFDIVKQVAALEIDDTSLILLKPTLQGVDHGGSQRFEINSDEYRALEGLLERFENPADCEEENIDFFGRVVLADNEATLRKASIALVGRLPTEDEVAQVSSGDLLDLDAALDGMLEEDAFYERLTEMYNDHFLTDRYLRGNDAVGLLDTDIYPQAFWHEEVEDNANQFDPDFVQLAQEHTNDSVARAPLELINYIVRNDLPFTEILTADYMMVNAYSAKVYGIDDVDFTDPTNPDEWRPGRAEGVPHAGVLTDPMFLNRFPTTDTNRNRHRSRMALKFFLATDILQLADRPVDSGDIIGTNPTLNNPNCNVCHNNIDPLAGAFQNWDDQGRYAPGEIWHPEMLPPGYKGETMSPADWPNSLQWLAERITADELFALSAVHTAYEGLTGQAPLKAPNDPNADDFDARTAMFNAQNGEFEQLAAQFRDSDYNYKLLIKRIVTSGWFRAVDAEEDIAEYAEVGTARFLTPELLNRKIEAVTTRPWDRGDQRAYLLDGNEFLIFYGGIDSDGVTQRITNPNGLMSAIAARMANEMSCETTALDFFRAAEDRVFFPLVEPTFEPEDANGFEISGSAQAIRENIQHLHQHILGERLELDDPEIDRTYQLFLETFREGRDLRATDEIGRDLNFRCQVRTDPLTGEDLPQEERLFNDDNYTIRSWMAVITYMLGDYRFLHE
jgi:hypothetical protein